MDFMELIKDFISTKNNLNSGLDCENGMDGKQKKNQIHIKNIVKSSLSTTFILIGENLFSALIGQKIFRLML